MYNVKTSIPCKASICNNSIPDLQVHGHWLADTCFYAWKMLLFSRQNSLKVLLLTENQCHTLYSSGGSDLGGTGCLKYSSFEPGRNEFSYSRFDDRIQFDKKWRVLERKVMTWGSEWFTILFLYALISLFFSLYINFSFIFALIQDC